MTNSRIPRLPTLLERKIYKTGQTRGADDDVIFQNRVSRTSTVLIPFLLWDQASSPPPGESEFENGFIAVISPLHYFGKPNIDKELAAKGLVLGRNALVFYQTRAEWLANPPEAIGWVQASRRTAPLGGQYIARIPATTASEDGEKIIRGFSTTANKGAGIRLYEYASGAVIERCRFQLEGLYWTCSDSLQVAQANGMTAADAQRRSKYALQRCEAGQLFDLQVLRDNRIVNSEGRTICPLCLLELSAQGFFTRVAQAEGREVNDLTITQLNLFHISELRYGAFNHRPYNLGWGHHHCNVVVKDSGISETVQWMHSVIERNIRDGYFAPANKPNCG
jgi:hypothetical protein